MERVDKHGASAILGVTPRVAVSMAPRFAKSDKIGRNWTFDVNELRHFVRQACVKLPQGVSGVRVSSLVAPVSKASCIDGLYTQTIQSLRGNAGKKAPRWGALHNRGFEGRLREPSTDRAVSGVQALPVPQPR